jgi:hypothetical protein
MERRRILRRIPAADEPLSRLRLRTGRDLSVLDISDSGVLVEGARLLPGTHVDVHVVTGDGRVLVRSRVARAFVSDLRGDRVTYRSALAFERNVDTRPAGYPIPDTALGSVGAAGREYPGGSGPAAPRDIERLSA